MYSQFKIPQGLKQTVNYCPRKEKQNLSVIAATTADLLKNKKYLVEPLVSETHLERRTIRGDEATSNKPYPNPKW